MEYLGMNSVSVCTLVQHCVVFLFGMVYLEVKVLFVTDMINIYNKIHKIHITNIQ